MFANKDEGFQELFDRLLAYSSTKQSIQMSESKRPTRKYDPMDVDALGKDSGKGKSTGNDKQGSSGKGKGSKGQNSTSNVVCWNSGKSGHYERDCRQKWRQDKGWSETGSLGGEHADGWTWSGEQVEGWWTATDWQSSGQWMSANDETAWEPEEPAGGFEINGTERCWSRGKERRVRRWQRPREEKPVKEREEGARDQEAAHRSSATVEMNAQTEKRQTVISPTPTEQRVMVPPEIPHDTRICIEDFEGSDVDEWRDEREVQDDGANIQHAEFVHRGRWNAQARSSAGTWVKKGIQVSQTQFSGPTYGVGGRSRRRGSHNG